MTFYDSTGRPVAYTDDDEHIFLFSGEPVAYFYKDLVYTYSGEQLGRFNDGWIRDLDGYCVFFTESTSGGGPAKPAKHAKPARSAKYAKQLRAQDMLQELVLQIMFLGQNCLENSSLKD